jgi:hypothetical protein
MLAIRLLLFITFISNGVFAFTPIVPFNDVESCNCNSTNSDFFEDNSGFVYVSDLRTESFLLQYCRTRPKVDYSINQEENAISNIERANVRFLYLKYSQTIALKLTSFSISYPFHSFP